MTPGGEMRVPIVAGLLWGVILCRPVSAAQESLDVSQQTFQACSQAVTALEEQSLRSEVKKLEAEAARLASRLKLSRNSTASTGSGDAPLRATQAKLLRALQRLECKRLSDLPDDVARGPNAPPLNFVRMLVNFATDRLKEIGATGAESKNAARYFSGNLDPEFKDFTFGAVPVTIPTQRQPGELNLPPWWRLVDRPNPGRYFVLEDVFELDRAAFFKGLEDPAGKENSLLLFVHGFNVSFAEATLRAAQLAHDLRFPGRVMLYSWPSAGSVDEYWKDEDSSRISAPRFQSLLADLLKAGPTRIFIVAHSMGTRIVIPAAPALAAKGIDVSKISELMLAAADFNAVEFQAIARDFAKLRARGTRVTLYAASNDFALGLSSRIHSYARLGQSAPRLFTYPGLDSVDASGVAPMRRAYGHSYVSDSAQVLGDMQDVVLKSLPPANRGLLPLPNTDSNGWAIPTLK